MFNFFHIDAWRPIDIKQDIWSWIDKFDGDTTIIAGEKQIVKCVGLWYVSFFKLLFFKKYPRQHMRDKWSSLSYWENRKHIQPQKQFLQANHLFWPQNYVSIHAISNDKMQTLNSSSLLSSTGGHFICANQPIAGSIVFGKGKS